MAFEDLNVSVKEMKHDDRGRVPGTGPLRPFFLASHLLFIYF